MLEKIGINPVSLIAQIINFGLLLFILSKLLYKPVLRLFDERAKKIAQGLKAAEDSLKEKEKIEEMKKEEMKKNRQEMEKLLVQASQQAKTLSNEIILKARQEAKEAAEKEYQNLELRLRTEEKQLKERVGNLVLELTKKTLQKTLDPEMQKKIFAAQLKKLKSVSVN